MFWVFFVLSIILNIALGYYSFNAARKLMNISENISLFWADLIEYKDFLDSLMDMKMYKNNTTIKSFVQYTKKIIENIENFRKVCELSGLLTEEDLKTIEQMEKEFEEQNEQLQQEAVSDEFVKEWDRKRAEKIKQGGVQTGAEGIQRQ